jgi:diadenosine tetraphosphate (Ap4A) HIT family hydrolase
VSNDGNRTACLMCAMEEADEAVRVFADSLWAAEIVPGYEVPGWFILRARRHAELITGLDRAEQAGFTRRARDLVEAVTEATGSPATYLLAFGENHRHFHTLIAARGADVPADRRNGDILKLLGERRDPAAAADLLPAVRDAYLRLAGTEVG